MLRTTAVGAAAGLLLGLVAGLFTGLLSGITVIRESASTPSEPHRQAVTAAFSTIATITVSVGVLQTGPLVEVIGGMLVGLPLSIAASGTSTQFRHREVQEYFESRAPIAASARTVR